MSFSSLKELLLRKTEDESLRTLIKMVAEDVLADQVIESLEKMAVHTKKVSKVANEALKDFATRMDPEHGPDLLREALGHHASRYKAALDTGDQKIANTHAASFFKIMDLVHHLQPHTHGKLQADLVDIKPWERTHPSRLETFADKIAHDPEYAKDNPVTRGKKKPHHYRIDTVGFSFQPKGGDWSFIQNDPHASYGDETTRHGHVGAYPMEHTKINGKYIPIENVENIYDGKSNHPFDSHPVLSHFDEPSNKRTNGIRDAEYATQRKQFERSGLDSHDAHINDLKQSGAYESRGLKVGQQVHAGSKRLERQNQEKEFKPAETVAASVPTQERPKVITRKAPASDKEKAKALLPSYLHDLLKD
jgi:hypothetical protein